jgi:hypothetical protein
VQVIQIGSRTCGKPYGFYAKDNCGTTYFTIQFKGVNAVGRAEYADGFAPTNNPSGGGELLAGCSVRDDFQFALGNPSEDRLEAALGYRLGGICPAPSGKASNGVQVERDEQLDGVAPKSPLLMNRWLEAL